MFRFILSILLCSAISQQLLAAEEWTKNTFREDTKNHYYIGVSEGKSELNEALEEAYQNAIGEAIRHNFGFLKKESKSIQSSLYKVSVDERSFIKSENVIVKDVRPGRQLLQKKNGAYLVYREVIYPKNSIELEKKRLKELDEKSTLVNAYGIQGKVMGEILIRTKPSLAQIILTRVDGKGSVVGTGDARFKVPLGEYFLSIIKEGFILHKNRVVVSGKASDYEVELKPAVGFLDLDIDLKSAKVYLNNISIETKGRIPLQVGRDYTLRVEHGDYHTYVENINIWVGQVIHFAPELKPKRAIVNVITRPAGAAVYIDGRRYGRTPLEEFSYEPRDNTEIIIKKSGYENIVTTIDLKPNQHHEPLIFTLKKVHEKSKKFDGDKKRSYSTDTNFDLSFLSNNFSKHNLIYNPVVMDRSQFTYVLVPIQYQYFLYRHLGMGMDYRYHMEEEDIVVDGNDLRKESVTQIWSLNSTLYLIRNRRFSLGFGPEYTWRKNQIRYYRGNSENRVYTNQAQESALGFKALMQIGLIERDNGQHFGINIDYRSYDRDRPELTSWSFGLYWEF